MIPCYNSKWVKIIVSILRLVNPCECFQRTKCLFTTFSDFHAKPASSSVAPFLIPLQMRPLGSWRRINIPEARQAGSPRQVEPLPEIQFKT